MENKASSVAKEHDDLCLTPIEYEGAYLKNGIIRGITYQVKLLTWVTWKLLSKKDASKWWLGSEVFKARGFHDLVLKYNTVDGDGKISDKKCMYRFVQIKHMSCLTGGAKISINQLLSNEFKDFRQYSLLYLFRSYLNMIDKFEKITPEQIVDLMIFTNRDIKSFTFLVPVNKDEIFGFEGKGKRYRFNLDELRNVPKHPVIVHLRTISSNETHIWDFLSKMVFVVDQPSEPELEKLIVEDMGKVFHMPQIFYSDLYKNVFEWFLILENCTAPYLTKEYIIERLKNVKDMMNLFYEEKITFVTSDLLSLANLNIN
ncbi:unnamed protein product [Lasius platythorax]